MMDGIKKPRRAPIKARPRCRRAGCRNYVKKRDAKYCGNSCSRKIAIITHRQIRHRDHLQRLSSLGRAVSTEDLLTVFEEIYQRAYLAGKNFDRLRRAKEAA